MQKVKTIRELAALYSHAAKFLIAMQPLHENKKTTPAGQCGNWHTRCNNKRKNIPQLHHIIECLPNNTGLTINLPIDTVHMYPQDELKQSFNSPRETSVWF